VDGTLDGDGGDGLPAGTRVAAGVGVTRGSAVGRTAGSGVRRGEGTGRVG
jgi:hypothetical protein